MLKKKWYILYDSQHTQEYRILNIKILDEYWKDFSPEYRSQIQDSLAALSKNLSNIIAGRFTTYGPYHSPTECKIEIFKHKLDWMTKANGNGKEYNASLMFPESNDHYSILYETREGNIKKISKYLEEQKIKNPIYFI